MIQQLYMINFNPEYEVAHCLCGIIHYYSILLYIITETKFLIEIIWFSILWSDSDIFNYNFIPVSNTLP